MAYTEIKIGTPQKDNVAKLKLGESVTWKHSGFTDLEFCCCHYWLTLVYWQVFCISFSQALRV